MTLPPCLHRSEAFAEDLDEGPPTPPPLRAAEGEPIAGWLLTVPLGVALLGVIASTWT